METFYGIFLPLGDNLRYGENGLTGKSLAKLNASDNFKSADEAAEYIRNQKQFDDKTEYFILPYYKFRK